MFTFYKNTLSFDDNEIGTLEIGNGYCVVRAILDPSDDTEDLFEFEIDTESDLETQLNDILPLPKGVTYW